MGLASCTTKRQEVRINLVPPPAELMQEAPRLEETSSQPTPSEVLETIVKNYHTYHVVSLRLKHLQEYVQSLLDNYREN